MNITNRIKTIVESKGAAYFVLIDPDKCFDDKLLEFTKLCINSGVDGFLVGGSLMVDGDIENCINIIKSVTDLPVIIFPGEVDQIKSSADAVLYISLISSRNAEHIIGKQIVAAPLIKKCKIEPISTGYMLIESGRITTAEYISGSKPIPRNKPEIAAATALAAEYLGMKFIYLEGGSGADNPIPNKMINCVSKTVSIPIIVGGGIRDSETAREKVEAGASVIITGNFFEDENNWHIIKKIASAVHYKETITV